jgi:hypothetical protein
MSGNEINASLALATIGSLAPEELVIQLHKEIVRLALSEKKSCSLFVKKKVKKITFIRLYYVC